MSADPLPVFSSNDNGERSKERVTEQKRFLDVENIVLVASSPSGGSWRFAFAVAPYLSCTVALMPVQKFFFTRTGALLGKMSCQDAKLEIEDPDAYYAAHYAPPLGV